MSDAVAATEVTRPTYRGARIRHSATLIVAAMDHEQWLEQHDRMIADHDREMTEIRQILRSAVRIGVREARNERQKRRELDEKITQLASAQLLSQEELRDLKATVRTFIESMHRGGNGHA